MAPCVAALQPGGQQVVTVNCAAEQLGEWNMGLLIDISDRDPTDHPMGIPYRLLAEICKPGETSLSSSSFLSCDLWVFFSDIKRKLLLQVLYFTTAHRHLQPFHCETIGLYARVPPGC